MNNQKSNFDKVIIKNAYLHNLKNINIEIPKHKLVVFTGVSGSGKSSLVFDTIYTEAQRQLIETFSTFARRRLPKLSRPDVDEIKKKAQHHVVEQKGSIAIRYKNRSKNVDSRRIVRTLAEIYSNNRQVALEKPDIEIRGMITDSNVYVGLKKMEINRTCFEERKVQHRPFFSPISLHPKIARGLVNLSAVKKDETLLDPFCGTGGILIEAGLIGIRVIGSDIEEKMIEGSRKTLDFYKIKNHRLYCSDIGEIDKHIKKVDSVVTDFPYGKSTTTKGEEINKLYQRAFQQIFNVLKEKGRAVIGLSKKDMISVGEKYFSLVETHEFRTHRSLTRCFAVYQK